MVGWTSRPRWRRDMIVFWSILFAGGALVVATWATRSFIGGVLTVAWVILVILAFRLLFRCARCGKSVLLWAARNEPSADVFPALERPDCPRCGFDGAR